MKFLSFILFALILITGCKKTTIVSGVITSSASGQAITGVEVKVIAKRSTGSASEVTSSDTAFTDTNGFYSAEVEGKNADNIFMRIKKTGFVEPKIIDLDIGNRNTIDRALNPYDAWLSVTFKNQSNSVARNFYFNYTGPFFEGEIQGSNAGIGPFLLQPQESRTEIMKTAGGQEITINWDTIKTGNAQFSNKHLVFCPRNDTTSVTINF